MYPFINALGTEIHMTWVWILLFVIVFLFRSKNYILQFKEDWAPFAALVPMYLVIIYLASSYSWYLIEEFVVIPTSLTQLMAYISPYEYKFHLIWLIGSCARCVWHFFGQIRDPNIQLKWIDAWFLWAMWACIPLWIFLLLWDTFIWQPTDSGIYVSAFHPDSKLATYGKVIPLWLYLSFLALILLLWTKIMRHNNSQLRWYGVIWRITFLIIFCFLILFQEYARRLVFKLLGKTRDIRNIILLLSAGYLVWKYKYKYEFYSNLH